LRILIPAYYFPGFTVTHVVRALKENGHMALVFGPKGEGENFLKCYSQVDIEEITEAFGDKIDLLLSIEAHFEGHPFSPQGYEMLKIPKIWWAIDTHLNFRWHKEYAYLFDFIFVAQKSMIPWLRSYGHQNVYWLPLACDPEIHRDYGYERNLDVAFVGNFTEKRRRLFNSLQRELPFLKWGIYEKVYGEEMAKIYSRAKIVVNPAAKKDVNMRTFEAMSCGALLLNEEVRELREIFEIGKDLDVYPEKNIWVLVEKIRYYLNNEKMRKKIALSGQRKVLKEHTYVSRVERILETSKMISSPNYSSARIILANSLVNFDQQFRNYHLAKRYFLEALSKDIWVTIKGISKYLLYNLNEMIRRVFKIWPY